MPNTVSDAEIHHRTVWFSPMSAAQAVKEYGEATGGQVFSWDGRSGRVAYYRCIRSYCVQAESVRKRCAKYAAKNTACPVRLAVFTVNGAFFVTHSDGVQREHNHPVESTYLRRSKWERERVKVLLRGGVPGEVVFQAQDVLFQFYTGESTGAGVPPGMGDNRLKHPFSRAEVRRIQRLVDKESVSRSSEQQQQQHQPPQAETPNSFESPSIDADVSLHVSVRQGDIETAGLEQTT